MPWAAELSVFYFEHDKCMYNAILAFIESQFPY